MGVLYKKLCRKPNLRKAARAVLANALLSTSESTREDAKLFLARLEPNITDLRKQLVANTFVFPPARGVAAKKPGKTTRRPIVIAPIASRVVQRAILDVLSALPFVQDIQKKAWNHGGVKDGGVAKAITRTYEGTIHYQYYVRTDIKDFFTQVPKVELLAIVTTHTDDKQFDELLRRAVNVELGNLAELSQHRDIFPLASRGVAQGSCLSPLLCNLLLHDIDERLNSNGTMSVRYIDDLIIFASNRSQGLKALKLLKHELKQFGLDAYEPSSKGTAAASAKAAAGETKDGFSFLGCDVSPEAISPGKKARASLLSKVDALCNSALMSQRHLKMGTTELMTLSSDPTLLSTLWRISNTVRAWGGAFSFCTDKRIFRQLDADVIGKVSGFRKLWRSKIALLSEADKERLTGMHLLDDTSFDESFAKMVASRDGTRAT